MRMICRVAAEFTAKNGELIFKVNPWDRLVILDAPEAIKDTLMFHGLLADGAIDVVEKTDDQKKLENDPVQGALADGSKRRKKASSKASNSGAEKEPTDATEEPADAKSGPETGDAA